MFQRCESLDDLGFLTMRLESHLDMAAGRLYRLVLETLDDTCNGVLGPAFCQFAQDDFGAWIHVRKPPEIE